MKIEDLISALTSIVVEKISMPESAYDAGEKAREIYLEIEQHFKDSKLEKLSENALDITYSVLGKDEVKLENETYPGLVAGDVYLWLIGDKDPS